MSESTPGLPGKRLRAFVEETGTSKLLHTFGAADAVVDKKRATPEGDGWRVESVRTGWLFKGSSSVTLFKLRNPDITCNQYACRCRMSVESVPKTLVFAMSSHLESDRDVRFESEFVRLDEDAPPGRWFDVWTWTVVPQNSRKKRHLEISVTSSPEGVVHVKDVELYDASGVDLS